MKEFSVNGYWWLPNAPEDKISGVLHYSGRDKTTLELFGAFNTSDYFSRELESIDVICGINHKGKKFSLVNCIRVNWSSSAYITSKYSINIIVEGIHMESMKDDSFYEASFHYSNLRDWYFGNSIELSIGEESDTFVFHHDSSNLWRDIIIDENCTISFRPLATFHTEGRLDTISMEQYTNCAIVKKNSQDLWGILNDGKIMQQFISFVFGSPQYFHQFNVSYQHDSEDEIRCIVHVSNPESNKSKMLPLLKYSDICDHLPVILKKWFDKSDEMYPIQSHLIRSLDSTQKVGDDEFLIVAQAIDGMSKKYAKGDLAKRIDGVYDMLQGVNFLQRNRVDSEVFKSTRNLLSHLNKGSDDHLVARGIDLIKLSQKSRLLLVCLLLHFYEFDDSLIQKCICGSFFNNWRFITR